MSREDYKEALRLGMKAYRKAVSKGAYPYLPALDDILSNRSVENEISLGIVEVPVDLIVGTRTAGRTTAFANNFMPLLDENTEFASKWISLCGSLMAEGLRDPVVAYEYMNHYYILEGNKRVSVMKYFGAGSIPAKVIRVVPKRNNSKENRLYFEFVDFYRLSRINYLNFSQSGSYRKLQSLVGKKPDQVWTEDEQRIFHSFYTRFEEAYKGKAGSKPPMTVSDALLIYLDLYPFEQSVTQMPSNFRTNLDKSWDEFLAGNAESAIAISTEPERVRTNILTRLIPAMSERTTIHKIAFIHDKSPETSGWTYGHELGRLHIEQVFAGKIKTLAYDHVDPGNPEKVRGTIERAISDGSEIIFTTTPKFLKASLQAAIDHPEVRILNCSVNTSHPYIRTYYGRMYEAKFLTGAIAGAMSENNRIGYIADYPIYGSIANINAFALGARMTNPHARIYLEWSKVRGHHVHDNMRRNGICYISDQDIKASDDRSNAFGLYDADGRDGKPENMAIPVWHWGKFYERILRSIADGAYKSAEPDGVRALNYWWGMASGVIDLVCSSHMPEGVRRLVNLLRNDICSGDFHPFAGVIYDQEGNLRHESDKPMPPEEIVEMNWLADNVVGYIPSVSELEEEAKEIVEIQGVTLEDAEKP